MATFLNDEDARALRAEIEAKYGSVHRFSLAVGIAPSDIYSLLNGNKPMYARWEKAINNALDEFGEVGDLEITLCDLCKRVEQISAELNALYRKCKAEREVNA